MRLVRLVSGSVAALGLVGLMTVPASAGVGLDLQGVATCQDDGNYEIVWTLTLLGIPAGDEPFDVLADITGADLSGAGTGTVGFSPDPIEETVPAGGPVPPLESEGTTSLPGSTSGEVVLDVSVDVPAYQAEITTDASVDLEGDCVAATTTTTAPASTTTTPAAAVTTATPRFTG